MKSFHKVSKKGKLKDHCNLSCLPIGPLSWSVMQSTNNWATEAHLVHSTMTDVYPRKMYCLHNRPRGDGGDEYLGYDTRRFEDLASLMLSYDVSDVYVVSRRCFVCYKMLVY